MVSAPDNRTAGASGADDLDAGDGAPAPSPRGEAVFVAVLALLNISVLAQVWALPFFHPDGTIGPGYFPISLSIILLALLLAYGVYLLVSASRHPAGPRVSSAWSFPFTRNQLVLAALIAFSVIAGGTIGLFACIGIVLLAGLRLVELVPWRSAVAFTAGTLASVYLIFDLWLGMNVGLRALF